MNTAEILLYSIAAVGVLVVIGWLLCLAAIGRVRSIKREIERIYGQENDIKKRIEQYVAKKASDELGKAVEGYKTGLDAQSAEVVKTMEAGTKEHLDSLGKFILQQEALITRQAEYMVGAIVKKAQEEIDAYKRNQLQGIDEEVKIIIDKVGPDVLGHAIDLSSHEDLVWKALEKAKAEGLFVKGVSSGNKRYQSVTKNIRDAVAMTAKKKKK